MTKIQRWGIVRKLLLVSCPCFIFIGLIVLIVGISKENGAGAIIIGLIMCGLSIFALIKVFSPKEYIARDQYEKLYLSSIIHEIMNKKDELLKKLKNDANYDKAKECMDKLPGLLNKYYSNQLATPLSMYQPVSSKTAGFVGSMIGGTAVGIASAIEAEEKNKRYNDYMNYKRNSERETKDAYGSVYSCYYSLDEILSNNKQTKEDIREIKEKVENEYKSKYIVTEKGRYWW